MKEKIYTCLLTSSSPWRTRCKEAIFKSKEAKEKPCGIDEASMEKDEGAEVRR